MKSFGRFGGSCFGSEPPAESIQALVHAEAHRRFLRTGAVDTTVALPPWQYLALMDDLAKHRRYSCSPQLSHELAFYGCAGGIVRVVPVTDAPKLPRWTIDE